MIQDQNWWGLCWGASENIETPYLFLQPLKLGTEKLVHNRSEGLPCQIQVLRPNQVESELGEYHSPPHYDDEYATHQKLMGTT